MDKKEQCAHLNRELIGTARRNDEYGVTYTDVHIYRCKDCGKRIEEPENKKPASHSDQRA